MLAPALYFFFFFNDTATTEIYTLSLHDALPICRTAAELGLADCLQGKPTRTLQMTFPGGIGRWGMRHNSLDRKSTRLNSSHRCISYAVFCLKKKKTK